MSEKSDDGFRLATAVILSVTFFFLFYCIAMLQKQVNNLSAELGDLRLPAREAGLIELRSKKNFDDVKASVYALTGRVEKLEGRIDALESRNPQRAKVSCVRAINNDLWFTAVDSASGDFFMQDVADKKLYIIGKEYYMDLTLVAGQK